MAYTPPGVEVRQVQESLSPALTAPNLYPVIVGAGYHVEEITDDMVNSSFTSTYSQVTDSGAVSVGISGLETGWTVDTDSVYVDIISTNASNYGAIKHLTLSNPDEFSVSGSTVSISGQSTEAWQDAAIQIGYRALRDDLDTLLTIEKPQDIIDRVGQIDGLLNPLAFGLSVGLTNSNSVIYGYGTNDSSTHNTALSYLALKEVYAMAPLTTDTTLISAYTTHCNFYSAAEEKKERVVIANPKITWADSDNSTASITGSYATAVADTDMDEAGTSRVLKATAMALADKRTVYTFPDVIYIRGKRHISTLKQSYLNNMNDSMALNAILAQDFTSLLDTSVKYYNGQEITDARWAVMSATGENKMYDVYVPVPGYYMAAAVAGKTGGEAVQQGFTNLTIAGISRIKYSNDTFSNTQLNTIAEGGNWIFVQGVPTAPIVIRHQLTTDRSSTERSEYSIIKSVDYVAKYLRNNIAPYIGRYNVTPRLINIIRMTITAIKNDLVNRGIIADLAIGTIAQDSVQKDVINVTVNVKPYYPANYIKIKLVF